MVTEFNIKADLQIQDVDTNASRVSNSMRFATIDLKDAYFHREILPITQEVPEVRFGGCHKISMKFPSGNARYYWVLWLQAPT